MPTESDEAEAKRKGTDMTAGAGKDGEEKPYVWIRNALDERGVKQMHALVERWRERQAGKRLEVGFDEEDPLAVEGMELLRQALRQAARELSKRTNGERSPAAIQEWYDEEREIEDFLCSENNAKDEKDKPPYLPHRDEGEEWAPVLYLGDWTGGALRIGSQAEDDAFNKATGAVEWGYAGLEYRPERYRLEVKEGSLVMFDAHRVHCIEPVTDGTRIGFGLQIWPEEEAWEREHARSLVRARNAQERSRESRREGREQA